MPNWKKLIVSGSDASLNSLVVATNVNAQSFTGSLFGTSSWALNATTASFVTASNVYGPYGASSVLSASYAQTASYAVNITVSGAIQNVDYIDFDTTASYTLAEGRLGWDSGDGTLQLGLAGGTVQYSVGETLYAYVYNAEATTLTKGQAVYISGAQGNRVAVRLARANVEATSFGTIGLVAETMTSGAEGFIIVSGALYKLNTTGLTAGATVYLSPTTAGAVTTTKPQAPDQLVVIGWVERVDNIVGSIYVKIDNGYELDELHDVQITSPQSGNLLIYDATTTPVGVWKNANLTDGTGSNGVVIIAYSNSYPALTISGGLTYTQPSRSGYRVYQFTAGTGTVSF